MDEEKKGASICENFALCVSLSLSLFPRNNVAAVRATFMLARDYGRAKSTFIDARERKRDGRQREREGGGDAPGLT